MNTLSIPQIFTQLEYYQQHYLQILNDSTQYYVEVEGAYLDVWPLTKRNLYLGELLQLWFAEKWYVDSAPEFNFELFLNAETQHTQKQGYIFAIQGNALTGTNQAQIWQPEIQQSTCCELTSLSKHLLEYKALTAPKATKNKTQLNIKPAI